MTTTVSMDPRIQARREAVQEENDRRRVRRLMWIGAAIVMVAASIGVTRSSVLDIDRIEVVGAERTSAEELVATSGLSPGDPMLELDMADARDRVAALPWIREVRTERDWPGTITFVVTERTPMAQVAAEGQWAVVDADGRVLDSATSPWPGLPVLDGVSGSSAPGGWLAANALEVIALAAALEPALQADVAAVGRTESGGLYLDLNNNAIVRLGTSEELDVKLVSVRTVLEQVDQECLAVLDVRVATVPVVKRGC